MANSVDVLVVGGGQAGLALGWYLRRAGLVPGADFRILDGAVRPGGTWPLRWPRLRLLSPAHYSSLPGLPMAELPDGGTPDAAHVASYLAEYEERHGLAVERPVRVEQLTVGADSVRVTTSVGEIEASHVVNCTGTWSRPFVPTWRGRLETSVEQLHTVNYVGPEPLVDKNVAVVGGGNSAAQIVAEIAPVVRGVRWVTRSRPRFLPPEVDGEMLFELASARHRSHGDGPLNGVEYGVDDLSAIVMVDAVRAARDNGALVAHRPFTRIAERSLVWEDQGVEWPVDTIIWATGFRPALRHLRGTGLVAGDGTVAVDEGTALGEPRLHFVGYGQWTGSASATLVGVGQHAKRTVARIVASLADGAVVEQAG